MKIQEWHRVNAKHLSSLLRERHGDSMHSFDYRVLQLQEWRPPGKLPLLARFSKHGWTRDFAWYPAIGEHKTLLQDSTIVGESTNETNGILLEYFTQFHSCCKGVSSEKHRKKGSMQSAKNLSNLPSRQQPSLLLPIEGGAYILRMRAGHNAVCPPLLTPRL